ncbi:hypothetical protein KIM372_06500 [Bombiscardovia nodaiensis]|uniref:WXG100 family type VII secretion target n=1 Tax=Bombiscardovia nodaiensis TaxID=2932181 RepID=A0ABM8B7F8_9BIFI|nr:hypothetical protein KIM372_06500 [Bombiscardovia nodaiensis]
MKLSPCYPETSAELEQARLCYCHKLVNDVYDTLTSLQTKCQGTLTDLQDTMTSSQTIDWQGQAAEAYRSKLRDSQALAERIRGDQQDFTYLIDQAIV